MRAEDMAEELEVALSIVRARHRAATPGGILDIPKDISDNPSKMRVLHEPHQRYHFSCLPS
jgi:hypothetical protein